MSNIIEWVSQRSNSCSIYSCSGERDRIIAEYKTYTLSIELPDDDISVDAFALLFFAAYKAAIKDRAERYLQSAKSYQTSASQLTEQLLNLKIEDI